MERVGGLISLQINGEVFNAKGDWEYGFGLPKRSAMVGAERVHGFTEEPQVPYVQGEITDRNGVDVRALQNVTNGTIVLQLGNGKVIILREAYHAGEGSVHVKEGNIAVRYEGAGMEEAR